MSELEGIAIIGMHGRFPGADSVEAFWENLAAGRDTISFFSDEELAQAGLDVAALKESGNYVAARGVMRDAECFDRAFFGIHPKEAEVLDPQHRVFLEGCWEALERSGYAPGRIHVPVGIYCGATFNTYFMHALNNRPELIDLVGRDQVMFGNEKDYIATRTAYKLNLSGPAISLNTACSSSLTAICQACQSLMTYQCDMAIAGGVSVTVPQARGYHFQEGNIGSPDGHTRTFDENAQGTVFSNGLALLVLKRLDEALDDGDQVHAVIKGFALNNDGADRVSFVAPGVDGQAEVISLAQALAGVDPDDISYVEAHGTATPVGDPIEVAALTDAFRRSTDRKQYCAIGSVKSNVGHLDAASGAAGLIKTALSLQHAQIPANPHFQRPNPKLDLENSPFFVNNQLIPWDAGDKPRIAGVSSFGTGGTNAHVIVEEAPPVEASGPSRSEQLLPLSAKTPEALERMRKNLADHLAAFPDTSLADIAFTLQTGRSEFMHRQVVVCSDVDQARELLETPKPPRAASGQPTHEDPPVVFMFPGQGAQFAGMGADLYEQEPVFREAVDQCAELLQPTLGEDLRQVLFPTDQQMEEASEKILQTRYTQPALFVIEYALAKLWMSWGIKPAAMIGHSVGEFVAACLAGVFSLEDGLQLIAKRAELVQSMPPGSMLAVRLPEADVLPLLSENMSVAAVNSPKLTVVAGPDEEIGDLAKQLSERKVASKQLKTSHGFHSPMMEPVIEPFTEVLRTVTFAEPQIPYVSNVTGKWVEPEQAMSPEYWAGHVRDAVRFADGIANFFDDASHVMLEVGPGRGLTQLTMQHPSRNKSQPVVSSLPESDQPDLAGILSALGSLWLAGVQVDWEAFYTEEQRRRVVLPTYPFEKTPCWPSTPATQTAATQTVPMQTEAAQIATPLPQATTPLVAPAVAGNNLAAVPAQPVMQAAAPTPAAPSGPKIPRKDRLVAEICSQLEDLSGTEISAADATTNLIEFGLDSLLLTQAATLLRKKYRTRITFRQLMEELTTIDAIASYLDENLPAEPEEQTAPQPAQPAPSTPAAATPSIQIPNIAPSSNGQAGGGYLGMLEQHLAVTAQVIQEMRQRPPAIGPAPAATSSHALPISAHAAQSLSAAGPRASHGPYKPLDSGSTELTATQQQTLDAFIARYTKRTAGSKELSAKNREILADPRTVAGFKSVWKEAVYPLHTNRSEGSKIWDVDGNRYVDFVMGFGASLFGHRPPFVCEAVKAQVDAGFETGPIHPMAGEVARLVQDLTGAQRVGFCSTGSEAVLAAIRVSRTVTGRDKIVIFEGAYHGIFDEVLARPLIRNGEIRSMPTAPGIPQGSFGEIIVLQYGNPQSLEVIEQYGDDIAAVLVEPIQARRLDLVPTDFLHQLRQITQATGTALVFDEVVTGFRVKQGGAQEYFGIKADLATYGKVVGGGFPIGIVTGSPMYMDALDGGQWQFGDDSAPEVGVTFFAGTFVRHPVALAAAKSVLTHLKEEGPELQVRVAERAQRVAKKFAELFDEYQAPYLLSNFSSLVYVSVPPEFTYGALLFCHLRDRGIHIFENRLFVFTTSHTDEDEALLLEAMESSLQEMKEGGFIPECTPNMQVVSAKDVSTGEVAPVARRAPAAPSVTAAPAPASIPETASNENRLSTLEEIHGEGDRPPLFCMPAADGLTLVYHELADLLGPNQPVYGLNSPGALGEEVPDSFEEMATRFVEDMREVQPHGPYCVIGYCSGGSVALEVAQQLVAAGEKVAFVCGVETYDWSTCPAAKFNFWVKTDYQVQRLWYHFRDFLSLGLPHKATFLRSKADRMKSRLRVWKGMITGLFKPKKSKRLTARSKIDWNELWRTHDEISVRYFPKRYPGKLLLIRPRTDYRTYVGKEELQADQLDIIRLRAFPACLMTPPHVDEVAELVRRGIDEGLRDCDQQPAAADRTGDIAYTVEV